MPPTVVMLIIALRIQRTSMTCSLLALVPVPQDVLLSHILVVFLGGDDAHRQHSQLGWL